MAKKRNDFRPDPKGPGFFSRMYITDNQRKSIFKWFLYSLAGILILVLQDVIFSRMSILGATVDLVPAMLLMICVFQGVEAGGTFILLGSLFYLLSGSAPAGGVIVFLTVLGLGVTMFREAFLRKGFSSTMFCVAAAMLLYEMLVFFWGLLSGVTLFSRIGVFLMTALLTVAGMPVLYPLVNAIGKIGGESWKE